MKSMRVSRILELYSHNSILHDVYRRNQMDVCLALQTVVTGRMENVFFEIIGRQRRIVWLYCNAQFTHLLDVELIFNTVEKWRVKIRNRFASIVCNI